MNREETKEAIAVMQHYADGGDVESVSLRGNKIYQAASNPCWDWAAGPYRIKRRSGECWAEVNSDSSINVYRNQEFRGEGFIKIRWEEI